MYKFIYLEDGQDCPKYVATKVNIILLYILYSIAYLLTGSMDQSPSWETNLFSASQEIPPIYINRTFITAFTSACHLSLYWAHNIGSIHVWGTSLCFIIRYFLGRGVVHNLPNPLSWSTTLCRLSVTTYSIYLQLPSILQAVPPSTTWAHAMRWWQVPTYVGYIPYCDVQFLFPSVCFIYMHVKTPDYTWCEQINSLVFCTSPLYTSPQR